MNNIKDSISLKNPNEVYLKSIKKLEKKQKNCEKIQCKHI